MKKLMLWIFAAIAALYMPTNSSIEVYSAKFCTASALPAPMVSWPRSCNRALSGTMKKPPKIPTATIEITKDLVEQRTLAVSARNIPTDYELTYTVTFAVHGPDAELLAPQTITLSRDYSFEENVLLAKEHEADILRAQMARDLVSMAMHRLARLK